MKYNPNIHHRRSIRLKEYDYSQAGAYFITICCEHKKCRFGAVGAPLAGAQHAGAQMQLNEYGWIAYNEWIKLPERFPNFELDVFQIMPNHMHGIIVLNHVGAGLAPAHNTPAHTTPAHNAPPTMPRPQCPAHNAPAHNTPTHNAPAPNTPAHNTPAHNAPAHNTPTHNTPGHNTPAHNTPAPNTPAHNTPAHNTPAHNAPAPNTPAHNAVHHNAATRAGASPAPTGTATVSDIVGAYKSLVANECLEIFKPKNEMMGKLWQRNYYEHIIRNDKSYEIISNYIINNPANWNDDKFYVP